MIHVGLRKGVQQYNSNPEIGLYKNTASIPDYRATNGLTANLDKWITRKTVIQRS